MMSLNGYEIKPLELESLAPEIKRLEELQKLKEDLFYACGIPKSLFGIEEPVEADPHDIINWL